MTERFAISEMLPGIFHIRDCMGVFCTLAVGDTDTLLWDTGYGLYDLAAFVAPYVRGQLHVILSHAHHDHACGHSWFQNVLVHKDDYPLCPEYTGKARRRMILQGARARGLVDGDFDEKRYLNAGSGKIRPLKDFTLELGGLTVQLLPVPGHTPGSLTAFLPQRGLLLTADSWNPTTWVFFPDSLPLHAYAKNVRALRALPAEHVLCSHNGDLHPVKRLHHYIDGLNDETFAGAVPDPIPPYAHIRTFSCHPEPGTLLVFNGDRRG